MSLRRAGTGAHTVAETHTLAVDKDAEVPASVPPPPTPGWPSRSHGQHCKKVLIVEDTREAEP